MAGKNSAVFGLYRDEAQLNDGVDALRSAGYRNTDISILFPNNEGTKDLACEKHTKTLEGTALGATLGLALGAILGWLEGAGYVNVPAWDPYLTEPVVAALAGAGGGGAIGALIGAVIGMAFPEYQVRRYGGRIRKGNILMSVHCDSNDWVGRAKRILKDTGAQDIGTMNEKSADFANFDKPLARH